MPLTIIRDDITKLNVNVIVNAANTSLTAGGGVCGAIFNAAGTDKLQKACSKLAPIQTGEAVITKGYNLSAKYIIHVAGPVYIDGAHSEEALLRSCYKNALVLAKKHGCKSIAFPLISSGSYGYPKDEALSIATSVVSDWLMKNEMDVSLVVFDKAAFALSKDLFGEIKTFIDENYVDERSERFRNYEISVRSLSTLSEEAFFSPRAKTPPASTKSSPAPSVTPPSPQEIPSAASTFPPPPQEIPSAASKRFEKWLDEPFSATLLRLIDEKGKSDVEVYKRANLDRKLFSKIRTGKGYMPSKKTIVALAVALELSLTETRELLERAGFALSRSVVFDVIIEYFITQKKYDIYEINNVLFEYDQPLLGG